MMSDDELAAADAADCAAHEAEEAAFRAAGWQSLNCHHPFYTRRGHGGYEAGTRRTIACTASPATDTSHIEWWEIMGDVIPPPGAWRSRTVFERRVIPGSSQHPDFGPLLEWGEVRRDRAEIDEYLRALHE